MFRGASLLIYLDCSQCVVPCKTTTRQPKVALALWETETRKLGRGKKAPRMVSTSASSMKAGYGAVWTSSWSIDTS